MFLPKSLKQFIKCCTCATIFITILLCGNKANAQTQTPLSADSAGHPYTVVEVQAKFDGGPEAWAKFLSKNIKTGTPVNNGAPPGRYTVMVSFLVDTTGKVYDVRIEKDPGYGCGDDVLRIFQKKTPKWLPAIKDGQKVLYRQRQMITYEVGS